MSGSAKGLGAGRHIESETMPEYVTTEVHHLTTADGAKVSGVLRTPLAARTVVTLMHPRADVTDHGMVARLLRSGYAVWTQGSRSPNNDLNLLHERAIIDFAAGQAFLRQARFTHVVALGHSGGGPLAAFYCQQAALSPGERIDRTPSGRPVALAETEMPLPDGVAFVAPHPGQGEILLRMIDPSVVDERDPMSVDHALDPFASGNGFRDAPEPTTYTEEFVARYRAAQAERIARIDARAADLASTSAAANSAFKESSQLSDRRRAIAPGLITVYRTDADLRNIDLSLDPSKRPYGSVFGRRPDLTDYGLVGFGRLSTAEAWMSTWSANTSNAGFLRCAPGVTVPTLLVEFTGDQASFPSDVAAFSDALGAADLTVEAVDGTHFGGPLERGGVNGYDNAMAVLDPWLAERYR
ncbi:alpha/beta hydrolase [Nocardia sp. NPDC004860]|uniref:alpha/beta hydrolase n=1 Tax=Nocardia sp. NPDC004860 TaxID=3154557 RepID=UPI0033A47771